MTLKSRLEQLQSQAGIPSQSPASNTTNGSSTLRGRLVGFRSERLHGHAATARQPVPVEDLAKMLGGELVADGLIRVTESLPLKGRIGKVELDTLSEISPLPTEILQLPGLYIDTETTGLSGGSGTLAFLVGIAYIEEQHLKLTQYLITRFGAEPDLLSAIEQSIPAGHRLISYNGKSYDLPLLASRFRLHAMAFPLIKYEHLDLLHPVRRLFTRCWNDCRLITLERQLLGFSREDDLPGSEAPEAWFSYLRGNSAQNLIKVIKHNRQDILSLALAHAVLTMAIADPVRYQADLYGLARWLTNVEEPRALALLQRYQQRLCDDGQRLLAHLLRRTGNWTEAVPIWESLAKQGCLESNERLAKYHEHISKDLQLAWQYCEQLPGSKEDLNRRSRLQAKLSNSTQTTTPRLLD